MTNEKHAHNDYETLACPYEHLVVIKLLAIHIETMKAYTLWWNGGTLQTMVELQHKVLPHYKYHILL
jgi:hypothetical protein